MLSSLLSQQQQQKKKKKKTVNQYEHRCGRPATPLEQRERMELVMMRYGGGDHELSGRILQGCGGRGSTTMMRFFPEIYVKLTTCNSYLKNSKAKPRLKWEHQLQERFVQSVEALGGERYATPKKILYMMNAIGLTLSHLKSHLQKYRIAVRAPPRRSRINRKKKTNSVEYRESSSSTRKSEANKQNAESSKPPTGNGCNPLKIQDMEMAMEVTSKIVAPVSASEKGKEPAIQTVGNKMIIESSSFASSKGISTMAASPLVRSKSNGNESETQNTSRQNIGAASTFATRKRVPAGFSFETKSYPLPPNNNICDIFQAENCYPIHYYSREEVIVQSFNVAAGTSVKEQFPLCQPLGQSSFFKNLPYSNQYSAPDSFGKVGGNRSIPGNYQMNTSLRISSLFQNTNESGSNFSSMSANSINAISSFSTTYDNVSSGSSLSSSMPRTDTDPKSGFSSVLVMRQEPGPRFASMIPNPVVIPNSTLSKMMANSIGLSSRISGFPSMIQNPMGAVNPSELGLNFPFRMEKVMEQSSSLTSIAANSMGGLAWCFPNPSINANPMRLGSNFLPMVATRPGSSFSPLIANSTELDSRFPLMISNPKWPPGSNLSNSRVVTPREPSSENPMKLGSSFLSMLTNRMDMEPDSSFTGKYMVADPTESEFGSIFSSTVPNANTIGPGSSSSLTLNENPMQPSGSSFSSMVENPVDSGTGTSISSTYDNSMHTDFSSSVLESPDENITADFDLD